MHTHMQYGIGVSYTHIIALGENRVCGEEYWLLAIGNLHSFARILCETVAIATTLSFYLNFYPECAAISFRNIIVESYSLLGKFWEYGENGPRLKKRAISRIFEMDRKLDYSKFLGYFYSLLLSSLSIHILASL